MRIVDLLGSSERRSFAAAPEADALTEDGALVEAALLDIRYAPVSGVLWLLFDCRGALQIEAGNTAILVLTSVRAFRWEGAAAGPRAWRAVTDWRVRPMDRHSLEVVAFMEPAASLRVAFGAGEFFVGDVPGCDDAPPNFITASDEDLRVGIQRWESEFLPVHASFLE